MPDYTPQLRSLMQSIGLTSFRALSQAAGVSERQIERLRQGQVLQMRVEVLIKLSQTLQKQVDQLIAAFSDSSAAAHFQPATDSSVSNSNQQWQQEYQRIKYQLDQQRDMLQQEFQQASLQILESWLLQFPTAAYAAQQNPVPASRLLPLMRPVEQLIKSWGVEMLAPVGAELPYDPQFHQLIEGAANPGEPIKIRYTGYCQGNKLLYRAKVSPVR